MSFKIDNNKRVSQVIFERFEKGRKAAPIGTISNGRKKVAEGKWVEISDEDHPMKIKEGFDGEMKTFTFSKNDKEIGAVFLRLKKGWNQLHISIQKDYQKKGYGAQLISSVIDKVGHIAVPDDRIVNDNFKKLFDKLDKSKYEIKRTEYDETLVYKKGQPIPDAYKDVVK
jgi:GNAT superfamily N-acetyltransferase